MEREEIEAKAAVEYPQVDGFSVSYTNAVVELERLAFTKGTEYGYQQALKGRTPITTAYLKNLLSQQHKGEISFSRMVELLNEGLFPNPKENGKD